MVFPKADGTGFFTTEKPDRTYKTEKGAKQAERMFQHPERWAGFKKENWVENQPPITDPEPIPEEPPTPPEPEPEEDPFIGWYNLPRDVREMIHRMKSDYSKCIEELNSNGWDGVHLSSLIEDIGMETIILYMPSYFI